MSEKETKDLARWLSKVVVQLGADGGGVKLHIRDPGDGPREFVEAYALDPTRPAERLAFEVVHAATTRATSVGNGVHRFVTYAYRGAESAHFSSHGFAIVTEDAPEDDHQEATAKSLLGQAQRHIEVQAKTNQAMLTSVILGQGQLLEMQQKMLEQYGAQSLGMMQTMQQLATRGAQLEVNAEQQKLLMTMLGTAFTTLAPEILPMLAKKFLGDGKTEPTPVQTIVKVVDGGKR